MRKYKHEYVWLMRGGRGVLDIRSEELNNYIDQFNRHPCPLMDFWEWLSFELDDVVTGFDCIWNQGNPQMSKVHIIKKVDAYDELC